MKIKKLGIVEELKQKHKTRLALAQRKMKRDEGKPRTKDCGYVEDIRLFQKWAWRVGKDWYGFNVGNIPPVWTNMLDDFLSWLATHCPGFEIHQIKSKLGSIRIYVDTKTADAAVNELVRSEIEQLRDVLRTPQYLRYVRSIRHAESVRKKRRHRSHAQ